MIKSLFRVITIPFIYLFLIAQFLLKWFLVAPLIFCLYSVKHILIGVIIGVIAGIFFTPIATLIIVILSVIWTISAVIEDMSYTFWGNWYINWSYASDVFSKNRNEKLVKKRKKYLKMANKKYKKSIDEFEGFDSIADIYAK